MPSLPPSLPPPLPSFLPSSHASSGGWAPRRSIHRQFQLGARQVPTAKDVARAGRPHPGREGGKEGGREGGKMDGRKMEENELFLRSCTPSLFLLPISLPPPPDLPFPPPPPPPPPPP